MELTTISQVSRDFGISTRTLRYYEQIGLLPSLKKEEYAYRAYDEVAIARLRQIIVLRKLRIPLRQIAAIFADPSAQTALTVFTDCIRDISDEITALSTMRTVLRRFAEELQTSAGLSIPALLGDESIRRAIDSLSITKIHFKEEKSMSELNQASESLTKLKNVRVVHLPPCTVAASHYIGDCPEENAGNQLYEFVKNSNLYSKKPDARVFGFNHPNPSPHKPYGYEFWVTIPDDMDVPAPLVKKCFDGGLYAAHTIILGNFHEWEWLAKWVTADNPKYEANCLNDGGECMEGLLEEHLNWLYHANLGWPESDEHQLDLLFPVRLK